MDHNLYHEIEDKAQILVDSLPYIRDFNQKIIIISFGCSNILTDEEEQEVMRDIALMKSIGMLGKPSALRAPASICAPTKSSRWSSCSMRCSYKAQTMPPWQLPQEYAARLKLFAKK